MPKDIEEFLKMAAQRRAQQKQKKQGGAQKPPQQPQQTRRPPVQLPASRPPVNPATDDEILIIGTSNQGRPPSDLRKQSVEEHVQSHINTSQIADHVSHLGEKVSRADDKLEDRLHQKFDHEVGHLKQDAATPSEKFSEQIGDVQISTAARMLAEMLKNPVNVRQAILISEVLKRPDFDH